jgi:hypothetical protein
LFHPKFHPPQKELNGTPDIGTATLLFAGSVTVSGRRHLTLASSVYNVLTAEAIGAV